MKILVIKKMLNKYLVPNNKELFFKREFLFFPPNIFLKGFYFDSSSFDKDIFALQVFTIPLFVPTDVIYFNFGFRIRTNSGQEWWTVNDPDDQDISLELWEAIQNEGIAYLETVNTPELFINNSVGTRESPHWLEAKTYALCLINEDIDLIIKSFNDLILFLQVCNRERSLDWIDEMIDRATMIKHCFDKNYDTGKKVLYKYIEENKERLL